MRQTIIRTRERNIEELSSSHIVGKLLFKFSFKSSSSSKSTYQMTMVKQHAVSVQNSCAIWLSQKVIGKGSKQLDCGDDI